MKILLASLMLAACGSREPPAVAPIIDADSVTPVVAAPVVTPVVAAPVVTPVVAAPAPVVETAPTVHVPAQDPACVLEAIATCRAHGFTQTSPYCQRRIASDCPLL